MKKTSTLIALAAMILLSSLPIVGAQKKPSTNISVRVKIENSSTYMITSDGRGDYVDGEQGVSATIGSGGEGDFLMDPTNSQSPSPRTLWFNFSQKIAGGDIANPWEALGGGANRHLLEFQSDRASGCEFGSVCL